MTVAGSVLRTVAAGALASAAAVLLPASPAAAESCTTSTGVTVVVDFSALGGSIASTCVPDGGGDAASTLLEVHHDLTRTAEYYSVVCRVDGTPADAPCQQMPPADAYWGLFWSDGDGGWAYASQSVDSLRVPDGGSVAFAWQDGGDAEKPGMAPPQNAASPQPTGGPSPSGGGTGGADGGNGGTRGSSGGESTDSPGTAGSGSPSATPSASATPSSDATTGQRDRGADRRDGKRDARDRDDRKDRKEKTDREPAETPSVTDDPSDAVPTAATPDTGQGLPAWVAPVTIAALFGLAGVVALLRRRPTP